MTAEIIDFQEARGSLLALRVTTPFLVHKR